MPKKFDDQTLSDLYWVMVEEGPRAAYRKWSDIPVEFPIQTEAVEDFSASFMAEFNERFGVTF